VDLWRVEVEDVKEVLRAWLVARLIDWLVGLEGLYGKVGRYVDRCCGRVCVPLV